MRKSLRGWLFLALLGIAAWKYWHQSSSEVGQTAPPLQGGVWQLAEGVEAPPMSGGRLKGLSLYAFFEPG